MYMEKRITNPLEKRRRNNRKTQAEVAKFLGITQSQYSRLENAECSPEPYLAKLAEFFNCEENELYSGNILVELENDFLNDGFKQVGGTYHEKKPDHIYLNIKVGFQIISRKKPLIISLNTWRLRSGKSNPLQSRKHETPLRC